MTFSEYRAQFDTPEAFKKAFGKLSEEEARRLINTMIGGTTAKACAMTTWRSASEELKKKNGNK